MADSSPNAEDPLSDVGLAVNEIVKQVIKGEAKLEFAQNDDDDDTNDWAQDEEAYDDAIRQIESIDLTMDDLDETTTRPTPGDKAEEDPRCTHSQKGIRNACLCGTHHRVLSHRQGEAEIEEDKVYGLVGEKRIARYHIDFIGVRQIWQHKKNGSIIIRGGAFTRTRNLDGRLEAYKSEVCRIVEMDSNDTRDEEEQSMIEVVFEDLHPEARSLHLTNKPFPECRFDPKVFVTPEDREDHAPLTCRWAFAMIYPDKRFRLAQRPIDGEILAHLTEVCVLKRRHRATDQERLSNWRGETSRGGSYISQADTFVVDVKGKKEFVSRKKYNAADMFSGAGGYTTGAKSAGIRVERAVDHWARCNATYKANHPEVDLYEQDIMDHCNDLTIPKKQFDLVHLSPPCQVWSPAHTCIGKKDPANIAALSACQHIVNILRPRMITFEQTFGIIQERHLPYFNALLQSITKYGYSLKWRVISLVEYGLPQNRKRLIMVGVAPGETLPPFPSPTHAAEPVRGDNKKRLVSAVKACWSLVPGVGMHNPSDVKQMERVQWDGTQPMNRTITTSGGQAYHWEGKRDLTLDEFAKLQGFPDHYAFKAPCIKKQIGNAFPPTVVHAIMKQLVRFLQEVDGIDPKPNEEEIIALGDDEDSDHDDQGRRDYGDDHLKHEQIKESEVPEGLPELIFDDVNSGHTFSEAMEIAIRESLAASPSSGVTSSGIDESVTPDNASSSSVSVEGQAQRATSAGQLAPQRTPSTRGSSLSTNRRRSSGGSSVVCTGQRQLPTIIEDDEDELRVVSGIVRGSSDQAGRPEFDLQVEEDHDLSAGSLNADHGSSSSSSGGLFVSQDEDIDEPTRPSAGEVAQMSDEEYADYVDTWFNDEEAAALLSRRLSGASGAVVSLGSPMSDNASGQSPNFEIWEDGYEQVFAPSPGQAYIGSSSRGDEAGSSSSQAPNVVLHEQPRQSLYFDSSEFQDERMTEDDAMKRALEASIEEAVQRHEQAEAEAERETGLAMPGSSAGAPFGADPSGLDNGGPSSAASAYGPLRGSTPNFQIYEDEEEKEEKEEEEEEIYDGDVKGKGKAKAVFKRTYDTSGGADNGSPSKRGRTE